MNRAFLNALAARKQSSGQVARAILSGDSTGFGPLKDCLLDEGKHMDFLREIYLNKNVFIKSVTDYYVGKLIYLDESTAVLEDAAWIPDTGRFHEFLANGKSAEVEPTPKGSKTALLLCGQTIFEWPHKLLREVK